MPLQIESRLLAQFAGESRREIIARAIRRLQKLGRESMMSSDESVLDNMWDEVCVQVQSEQGIFWGAYLDVMGRILETELLKRSNLDQEAMWLQTGAGGDWVADATDDEGHTNVGSIPVVTDDTVDWLREHLLETAADWTHIRARRYLEEGIEFG